MICSYHLLLELVKPEKCIADDSRARGVFETPPPFLLLLLGSLLLSLYTGVTSV
jgi:hypothetical protein